MGGQATQHATEHEPVEVVAVQIGNDHVGADRADLVQGSHTILGRDDVETAALESVLQKPALLAVSLGEEGT